MELRSLRPEEVDTIVEIHAATATAAYAGIFPPDSPFPIERTRRRWGSFEGTVTVAEEAGRVIGFIAHGDQQLHALYVLPEFWDRGVGARLLEAAGPVSELWVLAGNERARRFYERRGWLPDGAERSAFGVQELRYRRNGAR